MERTNFSHAEVLRAAAIIASWRLDLREFGDEWEQAAARFGDEELTGFMQAAARRGATWITRASAQGDRARARRERIEEAEFVGAVLGIARF